MARPGRPRIGHHDVRPPGDAGRADRAPRSAPPLQDETGGFTAFIAWTFQPGHTALAHVPKAGALEYLKTLAVSRLYLDNFANLQASWVTQGLRIGQLALRFGANDMGSLMIEENVVAAAGTRFRTTEDAIRRAISQAGSPQRRNVFYEV